MRGALEALSGSIPSCVMRMGCLCPEGSWTQALTHHGHLMDCQMPWRWACLPSSEPLPCGCPLPHSLPIPQVRCVEQGGSRWGVQPSQLLA